MMVGATIISLEIRKFSAVCSTTKVHNTGPKQHIGNEQYQFSTGNHVSRNYCIFTSFRYSVDMSSSNLFRSRG